MKPLKNVKALRAIFVAATLVSCICLLLFSANRSGALARATQGEHALVVLAVSNDSQSGMAEVSLDPVVIVEQGRFTDPRMDDNAEAQDRFAQKYLQAGLKYYLTFGGASVGAVTIKSSNRGCNAVSASGSVQADAAVQGRIHGQLKGLAVNYIARASATITRRTPTPAERTAAINIAKTTFQQHGAVAESLAKLDVINLTAIDADGDGKSEMVGSFSVPFRTSGIKRYLFLILEPEGANFKTGIANYQFYNTPETATYESGKELLIDYLDMDGDGVGEIVSGGSGYDAYGYTIYQKKNGQWKNVYSGGGDAC
ncbi:MAG TPA: hypothetical protein VK619_12920 [Pyrinomonadaceae bacterium]|nr:hypothetical protein [Pyrinomonadaceae bacterium]